VRVLLIAPPGAGKGTQAKRIASRYGTTHVSSGDIFREEVAAGTPVGKEVGAYLDRGDLVPDDLALQVVGPHIVKAAEGGGYILDGYPRTVEQAKAAHELAKEYGVTLQGALWLDVDEDELARRIAGRAAAEGRSDDADESVVRHRIEVFNEKTRPLIDYYTDRGILHRIDANGSVDDVSDRLFAVLDPIKDEPDS
jgi:adenylate kinase